MNCKKMGYHINQQVLFDLLLIAPCLRWRLWLPLLRQCLFLILCSVQLQSKRKELNLKRQVSIDFDQLLKPLLRVILMP